MLFEDMNIRVHPDEAAQSPNFTSIQLNDGTGDFHGMPTVFHSLHCLVSLGSRVASLSNMLKYNSTMAENNT